MFRSASPSLVCSRFVPSRIVSCQRVPYGCTESHAVPSQDLPTTFLSPSHHIPSHPIVSRLFSPAMSLLPSMIPCRSPPSAPHSCSVPLRHAQQSWHPSGRKVTARTSAGISSVWREKKIKDKKDSQRERKTTAKYNCKYIYE